MGCHLGFQRIITKGVHGIWSQKVTVSGCRGSWRVVKCGYGGLQRVVMKGHQGS